VTRPSYEDIKGGTSANGTSFKYGNVSASRGSPGLLPIESTNFDFSTEWYYSDASYLSVGYFKKATENFIGTTTELDVIIPEWDGLTDVTSGGLWQEAADLGGVAVNDFAGIKQFLPSIPTSDDPLMSTADNDPLLFSLSYPVNQKDANVYGWEFNIQHNFGESGFGFIANYTKAWSDVGYVANPTTEPCPEELINTTAKCMISQFALSGLSDSANLIAFYDRDGLNARIAYNWRDDFFNGDGQGQGAFYDDDGERRIGNNPTQTQAYGQVDLSASYELNDNLTLFMDGINVTNEGYRLYGRTKSQVLRSGQTGARYNLGVRYNF
jgi:TonB-dependent receptor